MTQTPSQPIRILFVCLGNICRSPMAEGVLRHLAAQEGLKLEIDSAGTADYHIGEPPDERAQQACSGRGVDITGLRGRQVSPEDFHRFDYILAMDTENLRRLRAMQPADAPAKLSLFMDYARGSQKGLAVPDPYYGGAQDFDKVLNMLEDAAQGLIAHIHQVAIKG